MIINIKDMPLLEIRKYPDPILRKKSEKVSKITEEIKKLGQDMVETMMANQGIGLAAPQVGVAKRIIVVQTEKGPQIFINPKICKKSREKILAEEGCLSLPGLSLKIKRFKKIEIEAINEKGEKIYLKSEDFNARIFQHEIDHLNGILIIDRISFWQRLKIKKELKQYLNAEKL